MYGSSRSYCCDPISFIFDCQSVEFKHLINQSYKILNVFESARKMKRQNSNQHMQSITKSSNRMCQVEKCRRMAHAENRSKKTNKQENKQIILKK